MSGQHQEEKIIDHCTIETFDTLQTIEEVVTVIHPGQRFSDVGILKPMLELSSIFG